MAITFHACKCPSCGADLKYEDGRKQMFCEFCGAKILIDNDHEFTQRIVDEARVKQAEAELERAKTERYQKEIEAAAEEKAEVARKKRVKVFVVFCVVWALFLTLSLALPDFELGFIISSVISIPTMILGLSVIKQQKE